MPDPVMFESGASNWRTPWPLVRGLERLLGPFDLDPCASDRSAAKAPDFWSPAEDGLVRSWGENNFCNPPWRRASKKKGVTAVPIMPWIRKACGHRGQTTLLLAARTDAAFFRLAFEHARLVMFVKGRLVYEDERGPRFPAPFPSAVLVVGSGVPRTREVGYVDKEGRLV